MRMRATVLVALLILLAGCNFGLGPSDSGDATETQTEVETVTATEVNTVRDDPDDDPLGWEDGYWHNESVAVDNSDGLNESELEAVVSRTEARLEVVRGLEVEGDVDIEIITRDEFRDRRTTDYTGTFRTFDNAKFEAMFLVGNDVDALQVQRENRGSSVLGYYDSKNDSIVLVSDSGQPQLRGDGTLAHELYHAIQDQHWNLTTYRAGTRDGFSGERGLLEGDANFVQQRYMAECGERWQCIESPGGGGDGPGENFHYGVYFLNYYPYTEGPVFINTIWEEGGQEALDDVYDDPPESAEQVIYPEKYGVDEPTAVDIEDSHGDGWERVRPEPQRPTQQRPDYAVLGQSGLTTMFFHTFSSQYGTDYGSYNDTMVVDPRGVIDPRGQSDPSIEFVSYDLNYTRGWEGDRMHVYERDGDVGYVWRIAWEDAGEASEFVDGYRKLLAHWGAEQVDTRTWKIPEDSPFTGAIHVDTDGDTVTIVKAPSVEDLGDVSAEYAG